MELLQMANEDYFTCIEALKELESKILFSLIPKDENDSRNVVLEIRPGTGGEEASLFALEMFRMYENYSALKRWNFEILSVTTTDFGGCKEASASISGENVFSSLKYERGVHRVQRVPETETLGRVHTSTSTVAVLPEAEELDIKIDEKDIRIDTYRSGGAGGQSVNKTESAIRITHIP